MEIFRIHISSWTASFRYPNMISGYQPTLPVPPLSTINGLISAALGKYFMVSDEKIAFVFTYSAKAIDLETIYQMSNSLTGIKSNVIKREFLCDTDLFLYTDCEIISRAFLEPQYPVLLGRSGDLAQVNRIDKINVHPKSALMDVKGTIIPFTRHPLPAMIQALPVGFSNELPRRNIGTQPYCCLGADYINKTQITAEGFSDEVELNGRQRNWDVYWQEF